MEKFYFEAKKPHYVFYSSLEKEDVVFLGAYDKANAKEIFERNFDDEYVVRKILNQKEYAEKVSKELTDRFLRDFVMKDN